MRAQRARRLVAPFAASILMAGGAAISAAGTAEAAPAVHTQVTTNRCFGHDDWRCFDHGGFPLRPGFCFNHPGLCFDHRFDNGSIVIIVFR
ncbi:hypothetical protein [Streptomyces hyaluromycini]|uniref:hypothetical protein n=1 Tax=Streptomyces hyaluromycini TaxID=1377993 RepID=UPI000B5C8391|nr:hypothetical protein [Streptomyces hyaluromycini]